MKIALCLSGQAREFIISYPYWKYYLLEAYDVDIFIHTWQTLDKSDLKIPIFDENAEISSTMENGVLSIKIPRRLKPLQPNIKIGVTKNE